MKIGIIGKATKQLLCKDIQILAYDIDPKLCQPENLQLCDMTDCEIIFVSVPTPMNKDGSCYLQSYILEAIIERNENVDRPDKDWFENTGRAVI